MLSFLTNVLLIVFLFVSGVIAVLWTFRGRIAAQDGKITSVFNEKETFICRNWFLRLKKTLNRYWKSSVQSQERLPSAFRVSPLVAFWYQLRSSSPLQEWPGLAGSDESAPKSGVVSPLKGNAAGDESLRTRLTRLLTGNNRRAFHNAFPNSIQGVNVLLYFCYYLLDWMGPRTRQLALIPIHNPRQVKSVRTSVHK